MEKRHLATGFCLLIIAVLAGCSKVPFTTELRDEYSLGNDELRQVQYFLSDDVVLRREVKVEDRKNIAPGHKLRSEHGKWIEEVEFEGGLPGVVTAVSGDDLLVSFEEGKALLFSPSAGQIEARGHRYLLKETAVRSVTYDGFEYAVRSEANPVYLNVREENLSNVETKRRSAKGIQLKE